MPARLFYLILVIALIVPSACSTIPDIAKSGAVNIPHYEIRQIASAPGQFEVRLDLPPHARALPLISRAPSMGLQSQVVEVDCDGTPIEEEKTGLWLAPAGCASATWRITAKRFDPVTTKPADQQSVDMGGWIVVSGPASLLRIAPEPTERPRVLLFGAHGANTEGRLESLKGAPSFFILGVAPIHKVASGAVDLAYVAKDLKAVTKFVDPKRHAAAVQYFASILGPEFARSNPRLRVVWFPVSIEARDISGAAGSDTILANYFLPDGATDPAKMYRSFALVLHEQFHQLQKPLASEHPAWVSESLAQYYALKASVKVFPGNQAIRKIFDAETAPNGNVDIGLLEVERQVSEGGRRNYGLFYSQGTKFWAEVDRNIVKATGGRRSLDDFLQQVLAADLSNGARVDAELEAVFPEAARPDVEIAVARYLQGDTSQPGTGSESN